MAPSNEHERRLSAARRAVAEACLVCRRVQSDLAAAPPTAKPDNSPVTAADWASQAVVVHRLREALGEEPMISEEDAHTLRRDDHAEQRRRVVEAIRVVWPGVSEAEALDAIGHGAARRDGEASERPRAFWTLDPIDGTKGFLRGGQYAVGLAWIVDGEPVLGALGCPNLSEDFERPFDDPDPRGTIYFAARGAGLFTCAADDPEAAARRMHRHTTAEGAALRICESIETAHSSLADATRVLEQAGSAGPRLRLDSQCKYAVVARGQADAFLRMPSRRGYVERIWDHAPGAVIAREGGCEVTDVAGRWLDFGLGSGLESNRGIVCAAPGAHRRLLAAIEALGLSGAPGHA